MKRKTALLATPAYAPIIIVDSELRIKRMRDAAKELTIYRRDLDEANEATVAGKRVKFYGA